MLGSNGVAQFGSSISSKGLSRTCLLGVTLTSITLLPTHCGQPSATLLPMQIIVPTSDTVRYTYLVDRLLAAGKHVLCVSEGGWVDGGSG